MSGNICVVTLHPQRASFCSAIAEAAAEAAQHHGANVKRVDLADLSFDPDFGQSTYKGAKPLEPDLELFLSSLEWSDHAVFVAPMWWGGLPAKAKGLFDRAFLPGRAFDPRIRKHGLPKPLFAGRTGRLILTSDTPQLYFRLLYTQSMRRQIQRQIMDFVGIRPVAFRHFAPVEKSTDQQRQTWLGQVREDIRADLRKRPVQTLAKAS